MTDEAKALVDGDHNGSEQTFRDTERNLRDLIETQAREIERLRRSAEYWKSIYKIQTRETQSQQSKWTEALSRAALAGDSHDQ